MEERERERLEQERTELMEESEERTDKQPRTDTDTDVESTQSIQKKEQGSLFSRVIPTKKSLSSL